MVRKTKIIHLEVIMVSCGQLYRRQKAQLWSRTTQNATTKQVQNATVLLIYNDISSLASQSVKCGVKNARAS